jgi:hypothetical protein
MRLGGYPTVSAPAPTERIFVAIHPGEGAFSTSNLAPSDSVSSFDMSLVGKSGNFMAGLPKPMASQLPLWRASLTLF